MKMPREDRVGDELIKKGLTSFFGAWLLVHEKADDVIRDVISKSRGKPEQERDFADRLTVEIDEEKEALKGKLNHALGHETTSNEDVRRLEEMLNRISERLEKLEKKIK
ncbi:MAG: hypothetical protein ACYC1U_07350 [Candidatus Aquicultorales bacterium]